MKRGMFFLALNLLLLSLPAAFALSADSIWHTIIDFGNLSFLGMSSGAMVLGFTRLLIWIAVFTVFYAVIQAFGGGGGHGGHGGHGSSALGFLNKNQGMIVAVVLATMAAVFLPAEVLLATGAAWATLVALVLIGGPVVGIGWLLWKIPKAEEEETKASVLLKIVICLVLLWILNAMRYHVGVLG